MSHHHRATVCVIVGMIVVLSGAVTYWSWPRVQSPVVANHIDDSGDVFDRLVAQNPGFVGIQECAACHSERVAEFRNTRHFLACVQPDPATISNGFDPGRGTFLLSDSLRFEMTRTGDEFLQTAIHSSPAGEQRTVSRIGLVYGAGAATDEVYFSWEEDRLSELPVVWLHPSQEWGASLIDPHRNGTFSRPLLPRCLECHNTWFEHVVGSENQFNRDSFMLGVTCEKCHGPGREHLAFHQAHPDTKSGQAIVHPGRLSRDRLIDLCAQCHSNAIKYRQPPLSYRPGKPLDDYFKTLSPKNPEDDHVANQVQYMRESRCFQRSDTMTCITCHDPHRRDNLDDRSPFQRSCSKCHAAVDCREQDRLPAAVRDNCIGCHMPRVNKIQVFFQTKDNVYFPPVKRIEHRIAVYPAARDEVLLDWYRTQSDAHSLGEVDRLKSALIEYWQTEGETRQRDYRFLAAIDAYRNALRVDDVPAIREKLEVLKATHQRIDNDWFDAVHLTKENQLEEARDTLHQILSIKPDLAREHGRLGTLYLKLGQETQAVESLKAAAAYDPDDPYGNSMLGWLAYIGGRPEEALDYYRRALDAEPSNAKIRYQMGLAMSRLNRWPDAVECFQQVLASAPNHAHGCQGMSHALRQQGRLTEALPFALRAARLTQFKDPYVLVTLAETYLDLHRHNDANAVLAQATPVAQANAPQLLPQIRSLQTTLSARSR